MLSGLTGHLVVKLSLQRSVGKKWERILELFVIFQTIKILVCHKGITQNLD